MRTCAVCGKREVVGPSYGTSHRLHRLPASIQELGLEGEYANAHCIITEGAAMKRMAQRRGLTLQQLVESQAK